MDEENKTGVPRNDDAEKGATGLVASRRLRSLLARLRGVWSRSGEAIYGDEDEHIPDRVMNCRDLLAQCEARCCKYVFALTRNEVEHGVIQFDSKRPYLIARNKVDGYCPHLDREALSCTVWTVRPIRCRRYHCREDLHIWPEGLPVDHH